LSAGEVAAQAITTDARGLETEEGTYPAASGYELPYYLAKPEGEGPYPAVIVVNEVFGIHEYIKDVCRRFAKLGYMAIAPELYARQGDASGYTDNAKLFADIVNKVPDAQVMSDLDACAKWASTNGGNATRLGITGFCWGGRITWLYDAHNPNVKAGVAWYGRLVGDKDPLRPLHPVDIADKLHAPVLGLYGAADAGIPVTTVDTMKAALEKGPAAAKASTFVVYPDTPHAFHADYRPSYREKEARDGWNRTVEWFKKYV
ncbi:MAG: dienelactone hydrolase family protein, partial [Burkholderiales bacterium]